MTAVRTLPRRMLLAALVAGLVLMGLLGLGLVTHAGGTPGAHAAGKPQVDASYANGTVVYMIGRTWTPPPPSPSPSPPPSPPPSWPTPRALPPGLPRQPRPTGQPQPHLHRQLP